ncbi:c-type cytochrome [Algibacter lectus]|uniref:c-type cytochrome n=1 Tax=Algibacter lectus TaxID=221126 RepID=UPI0024958DB2|nr:c-type cytochrome [Algibacter lectus]
MKNPKKFILQILISSSVILILLVGLFIFVIKKNGITEFDRKSSDYQPTVVKTEKTTPEFERGKDLFISDCNVCHKRRTIINPRSITNGILDEMGIEYFKKYLTKQDSLIIAKDLYATRIKEDYGNLGNSHNFNYSESELNDLIEYITTEK